MEKIPQNGHLDLLATGTGIVCKEKKPFMKKLILVLIACLGTSPIWAQHPEISDQDKQFAEAALDADLMELKLSEMAVNKGFSPEVKELAQHMIEDHKKADALLKEMAVAKSIPMSTKLDDAQQKEYDKLSDKAGEDFDKSYTDYMVSHHKKTIDLYEKETKKGENTELRAFATNTLPTLNHHRNLSQDLCSKLKKK